MIPDVVTRWLLFSKPSGRVRTVAPSQVRDELVIAAIARGDGQQGAQGPASRVRGVEPGHPFASRGGGSTSWPPRARWVSTPPGAHPDPRRDGRLRPPGSARGRARPAHEEVAGRPSWRPGVTCRQEAQMNDASDGPCPAGITSPRSADSSMRGSSMVSCPNRRHSGRRG